MASTTSSETRVADRPDRRGAGSGAGGSAEVHSVTTAGTSINDDRAHRNRNYFISMAIRTICFVLACIVPGPMRWVFVAGAVFLPYVAVVFANAVNVHPAGEVTPAHGGALTGTAQPLALWDEPHEDDLGTPVDLADHPDLHVGEVLDSRHHTPGRGA